MHTALMRDPDVAAIFDEGDSEVTLRWTDEATRLQCTARADRWNRLRRYMADLQTKADASERRFGRSGTEARRVGEECGVRVDVGGWRLTQKKNTNRGIWKR